MRFLMNKKGATMAEYAVIAVLIILVVIAAWTLLGGSISSAIDEVGQTVGGG